MRVSSVVLAICAMHLCAVKGNQLRRVCYHTNWSQYRHGPGKFVPSNIPGHLCTHLIYAFASMDGNQLAPFEWNDETQPWAKGSYEQFNDNKKGNPTLKTLLAVGGWNFGVAKMTSMLRDSSSRSEFVRTSIEFLRKRNFDGLDLDFEYPADRGSPPEDKAKFAALVVELRQAYDKEARDTGSPVLLLSAAVAAGKSKIDAAYDVPILSKSLDFINIMTYDFHGKWDNKTGHNSPLFGHSLEKDDSATMNLVAFAAKYWVQLGAAAEKINIGLALYGRSFTLEDSKEHGVGSRVKGGGNAGAYTQEEGYLSFYEVCEFVNKGARVYWIDEQQVPYAVLGDQWVSFDDDKSLGIKVKWMIENGFGGVMFWALDLDDFNGRCGSGSFPLLHAVNKQLGVSVTGPTLTPRGPAPIPGHRTKAFGGRQGNAKHGGLLNSETIGQAELIQRQQRTSTARTPNSGGNLWNESLLRSSFVRPTLSTTKYRRKQAKQALKFHTAEPSLNLALLSKTSFYRESIRKKTSGQFCEKNPTGFYADTSHCARYIECVDGQSLHLQCPAGTYFNVHITACMLMDSKFAPLTCRSQST